MGKIQLAGYKCERCEHTWVPRNYDNEPRVCPNCKSAWWNIPKKKKK